MTPEGLLKSSKEEVRENKDTKEVKRMIKTVGYRDYQILKARGWKVRIIMANDETAKIVIKR